MPDETTTGQPFDMEKLRELISLMEKHGLTAIDLQRGDQRWKMRRGPKEVLQMVSAAPSYAGYAPPPMPQAPAGVAPAPAGTAAAPAEPKKDEGVPIKSPTVGTFYTAAAPGDPPFVSVGSRVNNETVVCIIEAMKVFNQITAELSGTITEILVKNGDPVEFGQPLFRVRLG